MFMIDGFINDWYPTLNGARERILILKDIQLPGSGDDDPKSKTINGQRNPTIRMTRSQPQIWQIGNVGADAFFDLEVEGLEFWVLARDGNPLGIPYTDTRLWLPPGAPPHGIHHVFTSRSVQADQPRDQHRAPGRS